MHWSDIISRIFWIVAQPSNFLFLVLLLSGRSYINLRGSFSKFLLTVSALSLFLIGATPLVIYLTIPLESRYKDFHNKLHADEYAGIITLAGSESLSKSVALKQVNFTEHGERLTETVKLARLMPKLPIIFTGGRKVNTISEADIALQFFMEMGLDKSRILTEENSYNTYSNAVGVKKTIDALKIDPQKPWLLVTSAFHMPRTVAAFKKQGIHFHPYPVDYYTRLDYSEIRAPNFGQNLRDFDHVAHEWIGLLIYYITGRTDELFPNLSSLNKSLPSPKDTHKKSP